jgi:hypothetical protein
MKLGNTEVPLLVVTKLDLAAEVVVAAERATKRGAR